MTATPHHTLPAFLNVNGRNFSKCYNFRPFGEKENAIRQHFTNGEPPTVEDLNKSIIDLKNKIGNHTAWIVSNCDRTNGARARWEYAQRMINAG